MFNLIQFFSIIFCFIGFMYELFRLIYYRQFNIHNIFLWLIWSVSNILSLIYIVSYINDKYIIINESINLFFCVSCLIMNVINYILYNGKNNDNIDDKYNQLIT